LPYFLYTVSTPADEDTPAEWGDTLRNAETSYVYDLCLSMNRALFIILSNPSRVGACVKFKGEWFLRKLRRNENGRFSGLDALRVEVC
jgi:hypothetical protein